MTFRARWSNPLWEFLDIDPNDSGQEILRVLGGIVDAMPPVQTADINLHDAALGVGDVPLAESHSSGTMLGAFGRGNCLLFTIFSVWLLRKCHTSASAPPPPIEIDISTPQGYLSPVDTPLISPLERMSASASDISAGLTDMVSRAASEITEVSEDLGISESNSGNFEVVREHHLQLNQPAA